MTARGAADSGGAPVGTGITWGLHPIEGGPSNLPLVPGELCPIVEGVARVLAPNAGFFTGPGTNTYLVGKGPLLIIDPGPDDDAHFDAIVNAVGDDEVLGVAVTHHHSDHAPGAPRLAEHYGVPFLAHPGKLDPDTALHEGSSIEGIGDEVVAIHTPGHASDHLCFLLSGSRALFSGDHVMGGSTVVISPPDGDMAAYIDSVSRLRSMEIAAIFPAHGDPVYGASTLLEWYVNHRLEREAGILAVLGDQPVSIADIVAEVYDDVPEAAHKVAAMSVWAHLIKLEGDGKAGRSEGEGVESSWCRV